MHTTRLKQSVFFLLTVSSLALAEGIIDPGFEGVGPTPSPWKRVVFEAPYTSSSLPTYQCGIESVEQQHITRNGYARLDPIYIAASDNPAPTCSESLPVSAAKGWSPGLSWLKQRDIKLTELCNYLELTFDYRVDRVTYPCEEDCPGNGDTLVANVRIKDQIQDITLSSTYLMDEVGSAQWRRARIGVLRNSSSDTFEIDFILVDAVKTTCDVGNAFRAALEIDNVRLESFSLTCDTKGWICPAQLMDYPCVDANYWGSFTEFALVVQDVAGDAEAPFLCDRPCDPLGGCCNPPPCAGDLDGDGTISGGDLGAMLGSWGTPGGDVNCDGFTDGGDIGVLLGNWGCTS